MYSCFSKDKYFPNLNMTNAALNLNNVMRRKHHTRLALMQAVSIAEHYSCEQARLSALRFLALNLQLMSCVCQHNGSHTADRGISKAAS